MMKRIEDSLGCPLGFLQLREHHASRSSWTPSMASMSFMSSRLDYAHNLYRRDLVAHFGCVNAIEFSKEGCLLISGGDDRRVLLWNLEQSISGSCKPIQMKEEHSSNIFCLGFDSSNSKIFSAGNDEQVFVHDVKTGEAVNVFMHEEAIYGVSVNPYVESVFASAGEDGQVLLFDIRAQSSEPLLLARSYDAFHAVQFHPVEPMFVVTANSKEGVVLWDVRKPRVPFVKYGEKRTSESSMSARFNSNGTQIIALRRRLPPILFNTQSASPVCQFDADHYYNSCTMKSCCFAGSRDEFVLSGSDDFNLYMWRIPDAQNDVDFVSEAHLVLRDHRSIVNQVRFNPHNFTIASSGVEKIVKLWSPVPVPGSHGTLTNEVSSPLMSRRVYTHEEYIGLVLDSGQTVSHDYSNGSTDEDPRMMAFFDSLVQREVEGWTTNTDLSDDGVDVSSPVAQSSSSLPTSQSDDSDSDAWTQSQPSASTSTSALPIRKRRILTPRRSLRRQSRNRSVAPSTSNDNSDRPKPATPGSEWILRLIARKRAQIKAAKLKRKNVKKKQKSKAKQFIRCFTSSRQYLYRPENNCVNSLNRPNHAAPADLMRRRHMVAPYTIVTLSNYQESDNEESDDDDDEDDAGGNSAVATKSINEKSKKSDCGEGTSGSSRGQELHASTSSEVPTTSLQTRLWSTDSSDSSDDGCQDMYRGRKRQTAQPNDSGNKFLKSCKFSDFVSEIIESEASDLEAPNQSNDNTIRSDKGLSCASVICSREKNDILPLNTNSNSENVVGDMCNTNFSDNYFDDINNENSLRNVIPISGISTDETGSVLFNCNQQNSFNSEFDFLNRVQIDEHESLSSRVGRSISEFNYNNNNNNNNNNKSSENLSHSNTCDNFFSNQLATNKEIIENSIIFSNVLESTPMPSLRFSSEEGHNHATVGSDLFCSNVLKEYNTLNSVTSNGVELQPPSTPDGEESSFERLATSVPSGDNINANTPDSGISIATHIGDKLEKSEGESSEGHSNEATNSVKFSFKKKIPKFRLKNYRSRRGGSDDENDDDDDL